MIKNDFEKLNNDDWLKKEIEREKRISAWDFDEGKKVRNEHELDCDVKANAMEHRFEHERRRPVEPGKIENRPDRGNGWYVMDILLLFVLVAFHTYLETRYNYSGFMGTAIPFLLLMLLNPIVIIYSIARKKLLPKIYYMFVFIIAVSIELLWLATSIRYLMFLLR